MIQPQAELVCKDLLPSGTYVMLTVDAPPELFFLWGLESVMRVFAQSSFDLVQNSDGDLVGTRRYWLVHQHRGRLIEDVSEQFLQVITAESAKGQKLLYNEMTRDFLTVLQSLSPL